MGADHDNSDKPETRAIAETSAARTVGRYRLLQRIGQGATGEVWKGQHPGLGIPVAIKVLSPDLVSRSPTFVRRFLKEGHTAAKINHPNVVLGAAEVRFLKPVKVGEVVVAEAKVASGEGKKSKVTVTVKGAEAEVFRGEFVCFSLDKHVLAS